MRTTVTLDDDLIETVKEYSGVVETAAAIREALVVYVQREAAARLAKMGGTMPDAEAPPRRRFG